MDLRVLWWKKPRTTWNGSVHQIIFTLVSSQPPVNVPSFGHPRRLHPPRLLVLRHKNTREHRAHTHTHGYTYKHTLSQSRPSLRLSLNHRGTVSSHPRGFSCLKTTLTSTGLVVPETVHYPLWDRDVGRRNRNNFTCQKKMDVRETSGEAIRPTATITRVTPADQGPTTIGWSSARGVSSPCHRKGERVFPTSGRGRATEPTSTHHTVFVVRSLESGKTDTFCSTLFNCYHSHSFLNRVGGRV